MKNKVTDRRLAIGMLGIIAIFICIVSVVIVSKYLNRPPFAGAFVIPELEIVPRWRIDPDFTGDLIILTDTKRNTVAIIETGDAKFHGPITPRIERSEAVLKISDQRTVRVAAKADTLFVYHADGAITESVLPKHRAEKMIGLSASAYRNLLRKQ